MLRAVLFLASALAWASGSIALLRAWRGMGAGAWARQGDGVLFWLTWAGDPGSRRLLLAAGFALVFLGAAWLHARRGWRALRPLTWAVRLGAHPAVLAGGLLLLALPQAVARLLRPDPAGRPSVVLILLDTVRLDYTGWGGSPLPNITPHLDTLAARGAAFRQAISQAPWTKPSVGTLFTGLVPSRHLAVGRPRLGYFPDLPADRRTLAEAFLVAGYDTMAVSTNPNITPLFGFHQGFQTFVEDTLMPAEGVVAQAEKWLAGRERPFFLYLHFNDAHYPYLAPEGWRGHYDRSGRETILDGETEARFRSLEPEHQFDAADIEHFRLAFAEEVRYLDAQVGGFVERLLAQRDDVLVVIASDHGEEFLEHGDLGHGHQVYDELLRVPLQFAWGGALARAPLALRPGFHDEQVRLLDVVPTILEAVGLSWPPGALPQDGQSLLPFLQGAPPEARGGDRPALAETDSPGSPRSGMAGPLRAWREPGWKLIQTDPWHERAGRYWLFDLRADPGEHENLAGGEQERLEELRRRMSDSGLLVRKPSTPPVAIEIPAGVAKDLAELGYAQDLAAEAGQLEVFLPGAVRWFERRE